MGSILQRRFTRKFLVRPERCTGKSIGGDLRVKGKRVQLFINEIPYPRIL